MKTKFDRFEHGLHRVIVSFERVKKYSNYFDNLEKDDQAHYIDKWTLKDGTLLADKYNISEIWEYNVFKLPDITWPHIYNYLIDTSSDFTIDKLGAYKSLDENNFFAFGHVQDTKQKAFVSSKVACYRVKDKDKTRISITSRFHFI